MSPADGGRTPNLAGLLTAFGCLVAVLGAGWWWIVRDTSPTTSVPDNAVARVNGRPVSIARYRQVLAELQSDRDGRADTELRERALKQVIEEELLIQDGLRRGLVRQNARIRSLIVRTAARQLTEQAPDTDPGDTVLRRFYRNHRERFARGDAYRVRQLAFGPRQNEDRPAVLSRAKTALKRLRAGDTYAAVKADLTGNRTPAPLPDRMLPVKTLSQYIGDEAVQQIRDLQPGGWTRPLRFGPGYRIVQLVERRQASAPPFEEVRAKVRSAYRRQTRDRILHEAVDRLKRNADIQTRLP